MSNATLSIIQAVSAVITAAAIIFAFWQVRIAARQLRKQNDKSATEFVLDAEGQFDGMYEAALSLNATTIRRIFEDQIDPEWSDEDLKKFVYLLRYFGHISRMAYLLQDSTLDIGMTADERSELLGQWQRGLSIYKGDRVMRRIHENAMRFGNYNRRMLELSRAIFGDAEGTSQPLS